MPVPAEVENSNINRKKITVWVKYFTAVAHGASSLSFAHIPLVISRRTQFLSHAPVGSFFLGQGDSEISNRFLPQPHCSRRLPPHRLPTLALPAAEIRPPKLVAALALFFGTRCKNRSVSVPSTKVVQKITMYPVEDHFSMSQNLQYSF